MKPSGFGMLSVITVKFVVVAVLFTKQPVVSIVAFTLLQWSKYLSVIYMHRYFTTQQRMKWTHCVFKRRVSYMWLHYTGSCLPHQKYMYNDNKPQNSNIQHQTNNYYKLIFLVSIPAPCPCLKRKLSICPKTYRQPCKRKKTHKQIYKRKQIVCYVSSNQKSFYIF